MKSFTHIIVWSILLVCSACTDENETENNGTMAHYNGTPLIFRATVTDFEGFPASDKLSTRTSATNKYFKTEFSEGDAIGIFAIKNGEIVDNIDNTLLIYDASTGGWSPNDKNKVLYWYNEVSYVAYYPYRENITIDVSMGVEGAIASLAGNEKLQPAKDQSTTSKYIESDLMIATGKPAAGNSSGIILSLQFHHQFTMLMLRPQAYVGCYAPENAGFVYHKESRVLGIDEATLNVNLNGITPYLIDSMRYCAIVTPQKSATIAGSYQTTNGRDDTSTKINYTGSPTAFASGKCYTLKVISPVPGKGSIERGLYPGDFVFQNETDKQMEIHPGDGLLEENGKIYDYEHAIGMVITCDPKKMTDAKCNENGWDHAYVMGLANLGAYRWGRMGKVEEGIPLMTAIDVIQKNMNGFSETEQMLKNCETEDPDTCRAFVVLREYREANKVPDGVKRSPWFMPSIGQWYDMLANICGWNTDNGLNDLIRGKETLDIITKQLSKVGNSLPPFKETHRLGFSCSSQYNNKNNWMLIWHMDDPEYENWSRVCLQGYYKLDKWNIRPFFAF